jgi:chitinase
MSIGGYTWSRYFSDAALTDQSRKAFAASCIDLFIKGNLPILDGGSGGPGVAAGVFDGFDIDWEWPANNLIGGTSRPQPARRVRAPGAPALPADRVPAGQPDQHRQRVRAPEDPPLPRLRHAPGVRLPRHLGVADQPQSARREPAGDPVSPDFTVESTVDAWVHRSAPRHELVVGMPSYSRGWTGVPDMGGAMVWSWTATPTTAC